MKKKAICIDVNNAKILSEEDNDEWKIGACCLCHCGLDYSDRAAFFKEDREEDYSTTNENMDDDDAVLAAKENGKSTKSDQDKDDDASSSSYFFRPHDPYLPKELYDKHNALVYCDGCDRLYHQKCHYVPLIVLPRNKWECLLCQSLQKMNNQSNNQSNNQNKYHSKKQLSTTTTKKSKRKSKHQANPKHDMEDNNNHHDNEQDRKDWLEVLPHIKDMFRSPPVPSARPWEVKWEYLVRHLKASLWRTELSTRLKHAVAHQASNYRLAETAALTLTSTQRNRTIHVQEQQGIISQQFAQTLVKLYGSRLQWRQLCFNLDQVRRSTNDAWHVLMTFVHGAPPPPPPTATLSTLSPTKAFANFVERVIFPFGTNYLRRVEPRTAEMKKALLEQNRKDAIPKEIFLLTNDDDDSQKPLEKTDGKKKEEDKLIMSESSKTKTTATKISPTNKNTTKMAPLSSLSKGDNKNDDDNDSGITLDNLQCCICYTSHATDDNDLVMCDGTGCYRAFHMKCLKPALTVADVENEDSDWFCPLCLSLSQTLLGIQVEYMGEDWEQERYENQQKQQKQHNRGGASGTEAAVAACDDSYKSWDKPNEVFPTAEQDYAAACQMKQGLRNKGTDDLLARILGVDQLSDHDSDDENEDEHFDLDSFQQRRRHQKRQKREQSNKAKHKKHNDVDNDDDDDDGDDEGEDHDDDDEESSHSSQATLVEMSSVELEIGKGELDALSKGSQDDSNDGDCEDNNKTTNSRRGGRLRRSRRLLVGGHAPPPIPVPSSGCKNNNNKKNSVVDLGEFNQGNIIEGKRGRKPVDYIRLNEAIFGDVPDHEAANYLDDADEHLPTNDDNDDQGDDDGSVSDNAGDDEEEEADEDLKKDDDADGTTDYKENGETIVSRTKTPAPESKTTKTTTKPKTRKNEKVVPVEDAIGRSRHTKTRDTPKIGVNTTSTTPRGKKKGRPGLSSPGTAKKATTTSTEKNGMSLKHRNNKENDESTAPTPSSKKRKRRTSSPRS